ncbi:MAG: FHA domain-containing protein [Actinomycetia bacterium]|nr:FHA domain-containing protein [Actinomycetes bacterium]MCP4226402.1 FHA domain-containing protein [Actinomycetes bacterium]MCP5033475.1 FHA domain-containing protein [Actinomycetes bacterium]
MDSTCSSCGYENPLGARFCSSCGAPLMARAPTDDPTALHETVANDLDTILTDPISLEGVPEGTAGMFVVRQGPKRGSRIHLDSDQITIGRHPESDIFLDDVTVSRRHAEVRRVGDSFEVADAGSLNGTYVNQARVELERLSDGDELQVGKFKLVYIALTGSK